MSDGIEVVAVGVRFNIQRRTEQPDGNQEMWQWRGRPGDQQQLYLRWVVQSDGTLRPLLNAAERRKKIDRQAGRFGAVAPEADNEEHEIEISSRGERLGYYYLKLGEEHRDQASIRLPAGQIELSIDDIYGRPSQNVLQAMDEPAESSAGQLWLPAVVAGDSEWLGRVLGDSMTVDKSSPVARGFSNEVDLTAGETQTVTVGTAKSDE